ncbi:hypothetical protein IQ268_18150 [Oculatella sp. LEGE 06141]|uniref:hypothetical protein n=1 Tax=Oculatella sp. LEGE 06141 TaxID=1828648 RepID=UPI00187F0781|nr:hypothetical protein [Oculatella sp. LEGE 06141]MBE9180487.1 hypothetical protein [Oculatella sp. LEGE 06141]
MSETGMQTCPVCGVKILNAVGGDKVLFSSGPPGTRAALWAKVCQYTQKAGCINKDKDAIGEVKSTDYYQPNP